MKRKRVTVTLFLFFFGCAVNQTPPSPSQPWSPPAGLPTAADALEAARQLPLDAARLNQNWTLPALIDLALNNNTITKASWLSAKSAEAALGSARGSYYPQASLGGLYSQSKNLVVSGQGTGGDGVVPKITQKLGYAQIDYLLYDFGRREENVEEFKQALYAADFMHNAAIQDVILEVEQAYYQYIAYKSLAQSQTLALREANTNLSAAQERKKAGLSTIADVLQAETAVATAQLALENTHGQINVMRGVVATAVGVPPTTNLDVRETLSDKLPVAAVSNDVAALLKDTEKKSPVLAEARMQLEKARHHTEKVKAEGYPVLAARTRQDQLYQSGDFQHGYASSIGLSFPLFTGFSHSYDVIKAQTDQKLAETRLENIWQQRSLAVWSDYSIYKTAEQQIKTSTALLGSATQSQAVALGQYKEGVGSILDLLAAQRSLEEARAANIRARAAWLISLAQLKHDIGILEGSSPAPAIAPAAVKE